MHPIQKIITEYKSGKSTGIFSNCSANEYVLRAVMRRCTETGLPALIEATANQVNQDGGYTGYTPKDFYDRCFKIAENEGFNTSKLILGGDHLGPLVWAKQSEKEAMSKAEVLVSEYVSAGFTKIHIDTSMRLATDDPGKPLTDEIIAKRGAKLCAAAETAFKIKQKNNPNVLHPVYVIGSEVPTPGGATVKEEVKSGEPETANRKHNNKELDITSKDNCLATIKAFKNAFNDYGLSSAWERVIAIVVQPGVEFGEDEVHVYDSAKTKELCTVLKNDKLIFEGHSTDYQPCFALQNLVRDGIIILKVGPALTFAFREALFALENIEKISMQGCGVKLSGFSDVLEQVMLKQPGQWSGHYTGDEHKLKINRAYGFSDRARYYLPEPEVKAAIERLVSNLNKPVAPTLLSQFMPLQYKRVREGTLENTVDELILDKIGDYIDDYIYAVS